VIHLDDDLKMLAALLDEHTESLSNREVEAFTDMRLRLTGHGKKQLSDRQREWVKNVHDRIVPEYENLASGGALARGRPTVESMALDRMLAGPKVTKPPGRR